MANLLGGQKLRVEYPDKILLDDVTVGVSSGDRLGIVGRNGDGKSTLMRVLFGQMLPHSGLVTKRNGLRTALLGQEDILEGEQTVRAVLFGTKPLHAVLSEPRIRQVLDGLTQGIDWEAQVGALSGGQRRRLALARLLMGDWDVIGLDEPTNHLDLEGVTWLARHLNERWSSREGALLVVTHDRWFLDAVSTDTWEVHDGMVEPFEGGYAAYILARVERNRQAALAAEKRKNLLRKELAWLRRGAPAQTSKPKFRIDAANALIEDVPPVRDSVALVKLASARLGKTVVDLVDVDFSYAGEGGEYILKDLTWRVAPGVRAGILGANGAGKSTLLGLLSGELSPTRGRRREGKTVKIGVLDQEFRALATLKDYRVYEVVGKLKGSFIVEGQELSPAQMLERLGFNPSQLQAKVSALSGGQKRRLQILLLLLEEPNVMILDEPTNDIDTDTLQALEDVLDAWAGTLLVVSHDRYLLERITDTLYAVIDHRLRHLPGGVEEYLRETKRLSQAGSQEATLAPNDSLQASEIQVSSGKASFAAQRKISALERKLEKNRDLQSEIESALAETNPQDYEQLARLSKELKETQTQQEILEEQWLKLAEEV